jgi:hypothetical protein
MAEQEVVMRKMQRIGSYVWAAVALGGCDHVELGRAVAAIDICNEFTCENSDELLYRGFHGFRKSGELNEQNMRIRFEDGRPALYDRHGDVWELDVVDNRIIGRRDYHELSGQDLVDAEIIIDQENEPPFAIHIDAVDTIRFPFGDEDELDAYTLTRRALDDKPQPFNPDNQLCNAMLFPPGENQDILLGLSPDQTVVFGGDFYDIKNATTSCDSDWINFSCGGRTLAKLLLTRNTCESQQENDHEETLARARQATLKLLIADYCGNGAHFTVPGQPLVWMGGLVERFATEPASLEARWDENGAICLHIPRLVANPSPDAGLPPNTWNWIFQRCGAQTPPFCANLHTEDFDGALRVSGNR